MDLMPCEWGVRVPEFHPGPKGNKTPKSCLNNGDSPSSSSSFILESFCTVEHSWTSVPYVGVVRKRQSQGSYGTNG